MKNQAPFFSRVPLLLHATSLLVIMAFMNGLTAHADLVARYNFEAPNDPGEDTSGNGNDNNCTGSSGPNDDISSTDAAVGTRSREFFGDTSICFTDSGNAFPNLSNAISGSFTVTAWVKTTGEVGSDEDEAYWGMPVVYADGDGANYAHPLSITGTKAAFTVYDDNDVPTTVHSTSTVNDGNYHFIAVTRNLSNGLMSMYVDGALEATETGTTEPLVAATYFDIAGGNEHYEGLLDDVRIYSTALTANDVAILAGGHTLVAHYTFEDNQIQATDFSGNGNHVTSTGSSGTGGTRFITNNPALGTRAAYLDNNGGAGAGFLIGPSSLFPTLAGSFTISLWVQTTQVSGNDTDLGFSNAGLVSTFSGGGDTVRPMVLTGRKLGFYTGGSPGGTLHSTASITNDSQFVHVVVTRDQSSGAKKIYVNGALNSSSTGSTASFNVTTLFIGWNGGPGFQGVMDEIQFYAGVLSDAEVAFLYNNPTSTVPDGGVGTGDLAEAVDATQFTWTTGGEASWFSQTSETHDSVDAAQSGAIGDDESSWIETTVTGPGTISFWWKVDSDDQNGYDYLDFSIEGNSWGEISGDYDWEYSYDVHLDAGPQTLRWTYYKDSSDSAGADAAWLDEVTFIPDVAPTITFQPIDQTNYPGYDATLVADATALPEADWQWYKVGSGVITGAVNRFYVVTNSGTPSVAGSYYAIASNPLGIATTRTAIVSFVSAPLPPDWSKAFQTQLDGNFDVPRTNYGIASLVDASGNVYSANSFTGTNSFGTNTFAAGPGRFAAGLFKHSATGTALWGRAITNNGDGNSYPQCLAPAPGDGVYMSGAFLGTNGIGTNVLQEIGDGSLYLVRFDSAGEVLWVRTFGGTNSQFQSYHQLVADPDGNVTISALGNNLVNFGTTNIVLNGQRGVLVQYDANGNLRWIAQPSGWVKYMTYNSGRIYAAMNGNETNYIGGMTNTSDRSYALTALNATNGQALWLHGIGSAAGVGNGGGEDPAVSVSGSDIFVTGTGWGSNAAFGPFTVSWPTPNGQYLARYHTNGTAQLAVTFGGTNTWPRAAVADASGNVYVTGDFDGYSTFGNKTIGGPRLGSLEDVFFGQMFLAKFDRDGNSLWVRQAQSETPTSFVNVRDLSLAADGVWACGFVNYYANFGTNSANRVYGPITIIGSPFGFIHYWTGGYLAKVTESGAVEPPLPVTLLNPQTPGGNFQFQFLSQTGRTNTVQSRTNLMLGTWLDRTNILGDGSTKTVTLPLNSEPAEFFRVFTQ